MQFNEVGCAFIYVDDGKNKISTGSLEILSFDKNDLLCFKEFWWLADTNSVSYSSLTNWLAFLLHVRHSEQVNCFLCLK